MKTKKTKKANNREKTDSAMSSENLKECLADVKDIATGKFNGFIYVAKEYKPGAISGTIFAHQFSKANAVKSLVKGLGIQPIELVLMADFGQDSKPKVKAKKK